MKYLILIITLISCTLDPISNDKGYIIVSFKSINTHNNYCNYRCHKCNIQDLNFTDSCGKFKVGDTIYFNKKINKNK